MTASPIALRVAAAFAGSFHPGCISAGDEAFLARLVDRELAAGDVVERVADEVGWLIESPGPQYIALHKMHFMTWTTDHLEAMRFSRWKDAADAMHMIYHRQPEIFDGGIWGRTKPVEHMWCAAIKEPQAMTRTQGETR